MKKMYEPFNLKYEPRNPILDIIMQVMGAVSIFALTFMMWIILCSWGNL